MSRTAHAEPSRRVRRPRPRVASPRRRVRRARGDRRGRRRPDHAPGHRRAGRRPARVHDVLLPDAGRPRRGRAGAGDGRHPRPARPLGRRARRRRRPAARAGRARRASTRPTGHGRCWSASCTSRRPAARRCDRWPTCGSTVPATCSLRTWTRTGRQRWWHLSTARCWPASSAASGSTRRCWAMRSGGCAADSLTRRGLPGRQDAVGGLHHPAGEDLGTHVLEVDVTVERADRVAPWPMRTGTRDRVISATRPAARKARTVRPPST